MTETIEEARARLCAKCKLEKRHPCNGKLEPITSTGEDCPYFEEKK